MKHCRLPSLAVALTLHHCHETSDISKTEESDGLSDVVGFVIGLLLGSDQEVRNWFSEFIRNGQKVSCGFICHFLSNIYIVLLCSPHKYLSK